MAIVHAVKSGNWSDVTVWNTGALPTSADDVYSNTFTVTIDVSPTVLSISNSMASGVTAGGSFVPNNGITVTCTGAGVVAGAVACFVSSLTTGASCTLVANCTSGTAGNAHAVNNTSTGTINITGNCVVSGDGNNAIAVVNNSSGTMNITGNCVVSGAGDNAIAAVNNSSGTMNITGNCTGGGGIVNCPAALNASTGSLNITGICAGGSSSAGFGASNASMGTLTHVGTVQASAATAGIGLGSINQVTILTGPLISSDGSGGAAAASGVNPCVALRWFPADTALGTFEYRLRGRTVSGSPSIRPTRSLFLTNAYSSTYPSASNVRSGVSYGPGGIYSGTMAVPPASSVLPGVPVDNMVGTANLEITPEAFWDVPSSSEFTPGSMGDRLKNIASVASIGDLIASLE